MSVRHGIRLRLQRKEEGCECMWHDNPNYWASQVALVVKDLPANAGDIRDTSLIPGLGRSSGEGNGNPRQYSCLQNPMDRGAWQVTVQGHRVGHDSSDSVHTHMLSESGNKDVISNGSTDRFGDLLE